MCGAYEYESYCPEDCTAECGGSTTAPDTCDADEDCSTCPTDCGPCAGDGRCSEGESCGPGSDCGPCPCPDVVVVHCGDTVTGTTCGAGDDYETGCAPEGTEDVLLYFPWIPGECWVPMWTVEGFANVFFRVPELVGCPGVRSRDCRPPCQGCSQGVQIPCGEDLAIAIERGDGGCGEFTFTLDCEESEWL